MFESLTWKPLRGTEYNEYTQMVWRVNGGERIEKTVNKVNSQFRCAPSLQIIEFLSQQLSIPFLAFSKVLEQWQSLPLMSLREIASIFILFYETCMPAGNVGQGQFTFTTMLAFR